MKGINKIKIVIVGFFVMLPSLCLFSEDTLFDFDERKEYKDTSFTMTDVKLPEVKKTNDIISERKFFRILSNGKEEEVLPIKDIDGKNYYKFKPNERFYSRYSCTTSQPSNQTYQVCEGFRFDPKPAGHNHNTNIPPYNDWDDKPLPNPACTPVTQLNNYSYIYFKAPQFSTRAEHRIQFYGCGSDNPYYDIVDIKIEGLVALKPAYQDSLHQYTTYYTLIGSTPTHPANHFARSQTIDLLKEIAWKYHEEFPKSEVLNINDISLIWGGLFDVNNNWKPPHTFHRYGRQVDIRSWSIHPENVERFKQICCELGVEVELHSKDHKPLNAFESAIWEKTIFNLPPWNQLSEKELDERTPHYHLVFPKYDDEVDDPQDQTPQGCPSVIHR
ncbi:MAG: hypothetical protein KA059_05050 [Elusimicrobiales bacterium]|nr:hypothetical protein [Elusimicrobiales bacterium]